MTRPALPTLVKSALAAAVLAYLVWVVEFDALMAAAAGARPGWIALAVLLLPLNLLLEGRVWWLLVRSAAPAVTPKAAYGSLLSGYAVGLFTPGRVGEYAGRAFYLAHPDKWSLSVLVFAQHMFDLAVSTAAGLPVLLFFLAAHQPAPVLLWRFAAGYGLLVLTLLLPLLLWPGLAYRVLTTVLPLARARRHLAFLHHLSSAQAAAALLLSALRYAVYAGQLLLLLRAFDALPPWLPGTLGTALTFFASFLIPPLTYMDLGIREGMAVFFFGQLGLPEAAAFSAALLLFGINFVLPSVAGLPFVFGLRLPRRAAVPTSPEATQASRP